MANQRSTVTIVGVSGLIAIASALPMLGIVSSDKPSGYLVALAFPGMLLSIAVSGNAHAFTSWSVVLFSWIFYAVVLSLLRRLVRVFRKNG